MWVISYKNPEFRRLSDLVDLGCFPLWEGGGMLSYSGESWACQEANPNRPPPLTYFTFLT